MRFLGNLLWLIFGGLVSAVAWVISGVLWCITVIGIPFGVQCFKIAGVMLSPFGRQISLHFGKHPVCNVIWMLLFGWEFALVYALCSLFFYITVIGIPFGKQFFKLAQLSVFPFGAEFQ